MFDSRKPQSRGFLNLFFRKAGILALAGVIAAGAIFAETAEAKRMGGGRSMGRQSATATQQHQATPPSQSQSMQQNNAAQAQRAPAAPAAPAAAQPARNRWLGPIAGLAAGLGIAALLSHFGLGEAFAGAMANMIMIALIVLAAVMLFRFIMRKRQGNNTPAYAGAGSASGSPYGAAARQSLNQEPPQMPQQPTGFGANYIESPATQAVANPNVPAGFDTEAFVRNAKVYFVRLQDAWDRGNVNDIREFTTPEMFAEVKLDVDARGSAPNRTDVVQLNADVLGVEDRASEYLASVRFHGLIRESEGAAAEPFVEVWNLSKQKSGNEGWLLAGIQQVS
ncbi:MULTISPECIES: Tim44-like domain-containing protein [Caballeronia]|jgi:predicted lipid-binding transport protein (Tim44 family)|uniref:Membrane protein n=1 Tax=Caballeronia zhejiangensis TaxID=871203 RepID=A0A656QS75_9BURK|nr:MULTISPECIES: Tim44-like domain-containing protein [Caballeronia]EKS68810.1 import inner membrane translocase subunit Tim44 [Burkholderia sp. SJ98]KDR33085.1 membrane protein [Caballeronia zhejiangensis]MCG7399393.1 Tim44-like domain-containing protein [Caballeronia zhejiangensis]MCI1042082.1 Tim44 domain-containing protein [Caballeronia zhejiangensis]MDR5764110.1 Tim44-like domain-containing protein [Caballeronia sp. LZ028]